METKMLKLVEEKSEKMKQIMKKVGNEDASENRGINECAVELQPGGSTYAEKAGSNTTNEYTENIEFKSSWARMMSQCSLEKKLEQATEAAARMDDETEKNKVKNNGKKKLILGSSQELHEQEDWEWDQGKDDWDGVEDRMSRNKEKKKKEQERRRRRIEKVAYAGQCTIGLGPIKSESYDYFNKITGDFEEAKKMAAAEFLVGYLRFDHNDMSDTDISDTRISPKDDDILYIVMDSPEKIRNIRRRIADCRNPEIKTREYIPPQFFQRYTAMAIYAKERRDIERKHKDTDQIYGQ